MAYFNVLEGVDSFRLYQSKRNQTGEFASCPRNLTSARTVLSLETTTDSDIEESATEHDSLEIVESAAFELPYDDIPLFYIDNMPLAKGEEIKQLLNRMVSSSYMFFSAQNMFSVLDKLTESNDSLEASNDALCSLHDVVDMM
jgi:hypothetical protein